ncbi:MAG TPA: hypothetical protein VLY63_11695 [Anaerolineae bacterium]|nr:hypothetical protein [Anaerolineae bacterium]
MLDFLRTTQGRIGVAVLTSLAVVAFALVFTDALPVLPLALFLLWMPVYKPRVSDTPPATRFLLALAGLLAVLAGVGVLVLVLIET